MIQFELTNVIACPIDKAFAFLSNYQNMALWNYYIQSVSIKSLDPTGLGTTFVITRPHDSHVYKVVEYIPKHKIKIELQPPGPLQTFGFALEDQNGKTYLSYLWTVDLTNYKILKYIPNGIIKTWLLSFAKRHIMKHTKPAVEQNFLKLKTLLETGRVTLQDGRNIILAGFN